MQYFPRYIDVAHRVARHCATCCATLQLQLWNMFYCIQRLPKLPDNKFQLETGTIPRDKSMSRIVSRDTAWHVARRCSYNFETCPIVFSVCQNILIMNFSSKHARFHEIYRCHVTCHVTGHVTLQLQFWNMSYCIQRMPKPPDDKFQLETCTIPRDNSMSRIVSRDTARHVARRCSYNFETCPIVFSVCQNLLIMNFSS